MKNWIAAWKADKLAGSLQLSFLASVANAFWNSALLSISIPGIGTIMPFRICLLLTAALYLLWAVREKDCFWKDATTLEKWCYLLIAIMLVYGVLSLPRAIDFGFTFRKLFNLCFDLCFFFLMLRLCRDEKLFRRALYVCAVMVALLCIAGAYEVFFGGIFSQKYDDYLRIFWFKGLYQPPVVTFPNTNDYNISLDMCWAVFLLLICRRWDRISRLEKVLATLPFPVLLFLAISGQGRFAVAVLCVLFAGFVLFLWIKGKKSLRIAVIPLVLCLFVQFSNQYYFIVPPIQQYLVQMEEYRQTVTETTPSTPDTPEKPTLQLGNPKRENLEDDFFRVNEDTGEKELNVGAGSGGTRTRLLIHAFSCFLHSYGLGVGLGNTEVLVQEYHIIPEGTLWGIHCFVARIIADYGVFVLIPLCVIAFLLLKRIWALLSAGFRQHDRQGTAFAVLFFSVLLTYPLTSTAPADAQDLIAMWIYLASVVLIAGHLTENTSHGVIPEETIL